MNTNDEKIQWHPAFDAALQIELGEETKYLEFDSEHLLSKKPMQIDVLVKNEKTCKNPEEYWENFPTVQCCRIQIAGR